VLISEVGEVRDVTDGSRVGFRSYIEEDCADTGSMLDCSLVSFDLDSRSVCKKLDCNA